MIFAFLLMVTFRQNTRFAQPIRALARAMAVWHGSKGFVEEVPVTVPPASRELIGIFADMHSLLLALRFDNRDYR
eukprot:gene18542-12868_t